MSTPPRLRIESLADLTQVSIPAPEDKPAYNEVILAKVDELFAQDPEASKKLVGLDLDSFVSRRQEGELYASLRQRGFSAKVVSFSKRRGEETGVLIERAEPQEQAPPMAAPITMA